MVRPIDSEEIAELIWETLPNAHNSGEVMASEIVSAHGDAEPMQAAKKWDFHAEMSGIGVCCTWPPSTDSACGTIFASPSSSLLKPLGLNQQKRGMVS